MKLKVLFLGFLVASSALRAEEALLDTAPPVLTPDAVRARMQQAGVGTQAQRPTPAPAEARPSYPVQPEALARVPVRSAPPKSEAGGIQVDVTPREVKQRQRTTSKTLPGLTSGKSIAPLILEVKPGVTEVVKVAKSFPSLIMTPFMNPQVVDGGKVKLVYSGSNVYVMPTGDEPEALFISDKGRPGVVVSLMVMPSELPAQQITLQIEGFKAGSPELGDQRERKNDYISSLVDIMREVGQLSVPAGYTEAAVQDVEAVMDGIVARPDRKYVGADRDIYRYQLVNRNNGAVTLSEPSFYTKGVRAVALFPKIRLLPGQSTTLFIMTDKAKQEGGR